MNVSTETSIRALKVYRDTELRKILAEYHTKVAEVEARITEIRKGRGTKVVEPSWDGYYEVGRDREPTRGGW